MKIRGFLTLVLAGALGVAFAHFNVVDFGPPWWLMLIASVVAAFIVMNAIPSKVGAVIVLAAVLAVGFLLDQRPVDQNFIVIINLIVWSVAIGTLAALLASFVPTGSARVRAGH